MYLSIVGTCHVRLPGTPYIQTYTQSKAAGKGPRADSHFGEDKTVPGLRFHTRYSVIGFLSGLSCDPVCELLCHWPFQGGGDGGVRVALVEGKPQR